MYSPLSYDKINWVEGHLAPSTIITARTATYDYWCRSLYQRIISVFDFELPDEWGGLVKDFWNWCLFIKGNCTISRNEQFGYFFQPASPKGYNLYYQPTTMVIANPKYNAELRIGYECDVVKICSDWIGVADIIRRYAEQLSTLDNAVNMSIINSKLAWIAAGRNKAAIETLKAITDKINRGEPTIYVDKALTNDRTDKDSPFQFLPVQKVRDNYILNALLEDHETILNQFCAEIGIPVLPYNKAERMTSYESKSKIIDSQARVNTWLDSIKCGIDAVKKLYPEIKLDVKLKYEVKENQEIERYSGNYNPEY